jgi:hypothetical protein
MGSLLEQEEPPAVVAERDYLIAEREKSASVLLTKRRRKRSEGNPLYLHRGAVSLCAEHDRQLGGESPLSNLMEVKD